MCCAWNPQQYEKQLATLESQRIELQESHASSQTELEEELNQLKQKLLMQEQEASRGREAESGKLADVMEQMNQMETALAEKDAELQRSTESLRLLQARLPDSMILPV